MNNCDVSVLYNYEQLWCTSCTIMNNCDVIVVQLWSTVMCKLYSYEQLWCASWKIMVNCYVPVVQLWTTVMCQLFNYKQLWCLVVVRTKWMCSFEMFAFKITAFLHVLMPRACWSHIIWQWAAKPHSTSILCFISSTVIGWTLITWCLPSICMNTNIIIKVQKLKYVVKKF